VSSAAGTTGGSPGRGSGPAGWLRRAGWLGIRPLDVGLTVVVAGAVELNVATGGGPGAAPLDALAWVLGALLAVPILLRRRWPLPVLLACTALLFVYYSAGHRRNISPAPLLSLPAYDAAVAGFLAWAIVIPAVYMTIGLFVVGASIHQSLVSLAADFLPSIAVLGLAILLGEVIRGRRALAAETAQRLRAAQEERDAEAARRVAEERLRIARDLHDTVAHSMATITVQAGSALHLLPERHENLRAMLTAIRETSKEALGEMRATLGQLRADGPDTGNRAHAGGLDRLPGLREAVTAAGAPVSVSVEGAQRPLPPDADHAAYRILQEALTNVLRHAGPAARATVCLRYGPEELAIQVTDDGGQPGGKRAGGSAPGDGAGGSAPGDGPGGDAPGDGHGLRGMAERAAMVGGTLTAGPLPAGGFGVTARIPLPPPGGTPPPPPGGTP
jgi:signal transduction histidine kinase